jgi:anhydro-N-acetylmuramic acid kinase
MRIDKDNKNWSGIILGLMSGTSCDGLDLAACKFSIADENVNGFEIVAAQTYVYPEPMRISLMTANALSGRALKELDIAFSVHMANSVKDFIRENALNVDLISSHGHTVFHQPMAGYTLQIGSGATLAALSGIATVCDFRQADISLGGQGAPLVPVGDALLFGDWDYCLNLGGFANITLNRQTPVMAFDICAANLVLNDLAGKMNKAYDLGGLLARQGKIQQEMIGDLNCLSYYALPAPKSLGTEWLENQVMPVIRRFESVCSIADLLHTYTEHIAIQIASAVGETNGRMLVTGGGAWNDYLIERISKHCKAETIVAGENLINFKEALIFALLGWLRLNKKTNVFSSVTGARHDSIGGALYM